MGKRSNFERVPRDFYPTPYSAVVPLIPHLFQGVYVEPCAGDYRLVEHLKLLDHHSLFASDIEPRHQKVIKKDVFDLVKSDLKYANKIITNPPWDRKILHPMIEKFLELGLDTYLLFDADWMHTKQSVKFMPYVVEIISVGRVKWIEDSKMTGKDNVCWYHFSPYKTQTKFSGRIG